MTRLLPAIACLLSALGPTPLAAQAGDGVVDYTVQSGDTCASIARRVFGEGSAYDRIHDLNPQLGPAPHSLQPGSVLRLPARERVRPEALLASARHSSVSRVRNWARELP